MNVNSAIVDDLITQDFSKIRLKSHLNFQNITETLKCVERQIIPQLIESYDFIACMIFSRNQEKLKLQFDIKTL